MGAAQATAWLAAMLLAAPALGACSLVQGPINLVVEQADLSPDSPPRGIKTIRITVSNLSPAVARGVTVRDSLPGGYTYVSTPGIGGDAIRTRTSDPPFGSPQPQWGGWSIPEGDPKKPTKLVINFQVSVGFNAARTANLVEVSGDNTDTYAARPLLLKIQDTAVVRLQVSSRTPVQAGGDARYTILLTNTGTAPARGTFVSASLPTGFVYSQTVEMAGNSLRLSQTDPLPASLLPSWGTWTVPAAVQGGGAGQLRITFDAKVAADEAAGQYGISVTVTYNDLPAQTVADQGPVTVKR